jgi:hypothetical protein
VTDSELLDALQSLLITGVCVLRTCRSGIKIEINNIGDIRYRPEDEYDLKPEIRHYYGGESVRACIEKAAKGIE